MHGPVVPPEYEALVEPHVESMNYLLSDGLPLLVADIRPLEVGASGQDWEGSGGRFDRVRVPAAAAGRLGMG